MMRKYTTFFQKPWVVAVSIVLFFPIGLLFLWKHSSWNTKTKGVLTLLVSLYATGLLFSVNKAISAYEKRSEVTEVTEVTEPTPSTSIAQTVANSNDTNSDQQLTQKQNPSPTPRLPSPSPRLLATPTPSPTPSFTPRAVPVEISEIPSQPSNQANEKSCPTISDKYATINEITDSLGNRYQQSAYNECEPNGGYYSVKKGETLTITVNTSNNTSNPVLYQFVGNGFPNEWGTSNSVSVNVSGEMANFEQVHLRVFVKNSDDQYRAPDYDDMIQVFYTIKD